MTQIWLYATLLMGIVWCSLAATAQNPNDFCGGMVLGQSDKSNISIRIEKLDNNAFVLAGFSRDNSQLTWQSINVIGLDNCGNVVWDKTVGKPNSLAINLRTTNIDNNCFMVLAGYCADYTVNPYYDWLLLKFNAQGDTLWSKTYSAGNYDDFPWCIAQTQDGGFIMGGATDNSANGGEPWQAWLIKTDSEGNMEWNKTYGFSNAGERITGIIPNADGSYTIAAARYGGAMSTWVFKTDSVGNILWNRIHGNGNFTYPYTIKALPDGYLIAGIERVYGYPDYGDGFLLKLDTLGYQQWFKLYGGPFTDQFTDLHILDNGEMVALGSYQSNGWGGDYADAWLMKLTAEGDSIWSRTYAYNGALPIPDYVWGITDTPEGGFMFAGFTAAFNTDSATLTQTAWVVRTDSLGNACYLPAGCEWAVGTEPAPPRFEGEMIVVYPNPAQNLLHFTLQNTEKSPLGDLGVTGGWGVTLYTPTGHRVLHHLLSPVGTPATAGASATASIEIGHLPVGMYFYTVESGGAVLARGKVVKSEK